MRVIDRIGIHREIEPFLNVPASLLVCLGLTVVGYRVSTGFPEGAQGVSHHLIGVALSMLLIGLFLMVTRKKAITQILALLTVENAVFLVAVGVTSGMPLVVELGISFDVILAVADPRRARPSHRGPVRVDGCQPSLQVERVA